MAGTLVELVTVVVDGYELKEFQEIDCRRSMQDAAIAFSLTATHSSWSPAAKKLRNAENIEVYASGDLICMGGVDSYEADIGEGEHKTITLHGRSHARDVIDSPPVNHPTGRSENKTLLGHAQDLGAEFEVDWSADVSMEIIEKI